MNNGTTAPAAQALLRHGFDGQRLTRLAHRIAGDYLRRNGATLGSRYDDLVQFLCLHGLRAALNFDSTRNHSTYGSNGGSVFASYLADVLENRCTDFYRSKSEGFGDARYGNDNRIVLVGDASQKGFGRPDSIDKYNQTSRSRLPSVTVEPEMDFDAEFEDLLNDRQVARYVEYWSRAATAANLTLGEFVIYSMNRAAKSVLGVGG